MSQARFIVGDVFEVMASLPDGSVDLVLTSPPFLALRSYLPADHPQKAKEIGSEPTPAAFLDTMLALTAEWRRVLAPHGSIAVELGDTYAGSGGAGGDYAEGGMREGQPKFRAGTPRWDGRPDGQIRTTTSDPVSYPVRGKEGWPLDKSLCLIPELYRIALVYGFNPLTGRPTQPWRGRNVVRWCRPNPPVGALGDKVRPATSDIVIACMGRTRYFDLDAVRTPAQGQSNYPSNGPKAAARLEAGIDGEGRYGARIDSNPAGAPPLDHWWHDDVFDQDAWLIPTQPYKGAHYATWPEDLLIRPIEAMCPRKVCTVCGKPSERITRLDGYTDHDGVLHPMGEKWASGVADGKGAHANKPGSRTTTTTTTTTGWTDCGHYSWRNGVCLDPFAGSGTTLAVAVGHGRDAIGIDLDARNADLARERVGMFLTVENTREGVA
jgi:hypothetical protein